MPKDLFEMTISDAQAIPIDGTEFILTEVTVTVGKDEPFRILRITTLEDICRRAALEDPEEL